LVRARSLADGRRKAQLGSTLDGKFANDFARRTLPFDPANAARDAGTVVTPRASGRPASQFHAGIGVIARSRQQTFAARNTRDFRDCGIEPVDP
jgi:hypothetical protein